MNAIAESGLLSLLVDDSRSSDIYAPESPKDTFYDVHLDEIITAATSEHPDYDLAKIYHAPLRSLDAIAYRHEVFHDLADTTVLDSVSAFTRGMRKVADMLATSRKLHSQPEIDHWHLAAVIHYAEVLHTLHGDLGHADLTSRGLAGLHDLLSAYTGSSEFVAMRDASRTLRSTLEGLRYVVLSQGGKLTVGRYDDEADYTAQVLDSFERFRVDSAHRPEAAAGTNTTLDRVDGVVLNLVAELFSEVFANLRSFCVQYPDFITDQISQYEHDAEFYLGYLALTARLEARGVVFTIPRLTGTDRVERVRGTVDIALANRSARAPVANDYRIDAGERILAISGPNQGGKTTMARTIGQLHALAAIGVPVAAEEAELFLPDQIFTHFERSESIDTLAGKLEDELNRIHHVLNAATPDSLIILNETFGSTSLQDGRVLGAAVIRSLVTLGVLGVYVTFIDELTQLDDAIVSMKSLVDPTDVTVRTFKVERHAADGRAYARALASKYGLDYDSIRQGVNS